MCITNDMSKGGHAISNMLTYLFTTLGIIFFVSGVTMALKLRKYYPDFYEEYGILIWIATFCLTLPLFVRGINSHYYQKKNKYYNFYMNNFAAVNTCYVVVSSIVPIIT